MSTPMIRNITIDGEPMFIYRIEWGKYQPEESIIVAHREKLTADEIRVRLAGGIKTSLALPFPDPSQLESLGFVTLETINLFPGYMRK